MARHLDLPTGKFKVPFDIMARAEAAVWSAHLHPKFKMTKEGNF
jgi:hypothetical protein